MLQLTIFVEMLVVLLKIVLFSEIFILLQDCNILIDDFCFTVKLTFDLLQMTVIDIF